MWTAGQRVFLTITGPGPFIRCVLTSLDEGVTVRQSVCRSVCHVFVKNTWNWEFYAQKWSRRHKMSWITSKSSQAYLPPKSAQISSSHLSHLYKRICPKMHEDASLAAGPCWYFISFKASYDTKIFTDFFIFSLVPSSITFGFGAIVSADYKYP